MACLIGIDLGTSGTKSVVLAENGELLADHSVHYSPNLSFPGRAEQDPDVYLHAALKCIRRCLEHPGIDPKQVAGIGISGLAPALVLTDDSGTPLAPAQLWLDRRGAEIAEQLNQGPLRERILRTSGNPIDAYYGMIKLLWEKQHRRQVYDRATWCFSAVNYVVYRLTGTPTLDTANASLFGGAFDIRRRDWDPEILEELEVRRDLFPPLLPSESIAGKLTPTSAKACGLLPGTPVVAGTVDGTAVCLAAGAVSPGDAIVTLGTSALLYVVHSKPSFSSRLIAICYPSRGEPMYTTVGAMSCGGVLFRYVRDLAAAHFDREDAYHRLTELAAGVPPGSDGLVTLPYFEGERTPIWNPHARGVVFGLKLSHTVGHWVRSIMEGVAFGLKHNLDEIEATGIAVSEPMTIAEGGAGNPLWRQIVADVLGKRLNYVGDLGGAEVGAAVLAGLGTGVFTDLPVARRSPGETEQVLPERRNTELYAKVYPVFRDLYVRVAPLFQSREARNLPAGPASG